MNNKDLAFCQDAGEIRGVKNEQLNKNNRPAETKHPEYAGGMAGNRQRGHDYCQLPEGQTAL